MNGVVAVSTQYQNVGPTITLTRPEDVQEGDLLLVVVAIHATLFEEAATITGPTDSWMQGPLQTGEISNGDNPGTEFPDPDTYNRVVTIFKYASDDEPGSYTFTYSAVHSLAGALYVIRGAKRDFSNENYPYGYFAPSVNTLDFAEDVSNTLDTSGVINTGYAPSIGIFVLTQTRFGAADPTIPFDDPSPLVPIDGRIGTGNFATLFLHQDLFYEFGIVGSIQVNSAIGNLWFTCGFVVELSSGVAKVDNYKSKLLRKSMPPPYDSKMSSNIGKLLTVIGTSDNEIGGLYGEDDFLPDEDPEIPIQWNVYLEILP